MSERLLKNLENAKTQKSYPYREKMTEKPKKKDKPEFVNCMACKNYDEVDTWCLSFNRPMKGYKDHFKCRRYMPID